MGTLGDGNITRQVNNTAFRPLMDEALNLHPMAEFECAQIALNRADSFSHELPLKG